MSRLAPSLGETCSGYLANYRKAFEDAVRGGEPGVASTQAYCRVLDGLLGALFCASDAASRSVGFGPRGRVALVAVGGYGRGTLGLRSDVDVLFLCDDPSDPHVAALAEGLLYPLWDLGVDIGHAVRGVDETLRLSREDIATATTLIDLRRVGGDASIVRDLQEGGVRQVFEPALGEFLDALETDSTARHLRFGGSLYLLEPDVKQGRGGLRDLDVAEWAARARWGAKCTDDYIRCGALLAREVEELEESRELLWRVRNLLHLRAGRQQDRLTFADQEDIAVDLGYEDGITLGVEQFMQSYYRHARVVAQTAERILARARLPVDRKPSEARDLGDGTMVLDEHLTLEKSERLETDTALAFRLYRQVMRQELPPDAFARDAIARIDCDPEWRLRLQRSEEATQIFLTMLTHASDTAVPHGSILGELHEVGLLLAMIPEFEPLFGRVHHDVYHIYTVDIHSVRSVDALRAFARGETPPGLGIAGRLMADAPRLTPLFLGVLLHAIGKTQRRDHAARGAAMARPIAERLGLSPVDVEHVVWLIQEAGTLYYWATQRDIHDPETIAELVRVVGNKDRLGDLFLLTVASLSTINPKAMTSWKARMLEDLYFKLVGEFEGRNEGADSLRTDEIRAQVEVGFVGDAGQGELTSFLSNMPERYLLANPVDAIRRHARLARGRGDAVAVVSVGPGPDERLHELVAITDDRPGLLADVAAVLTAHRLQIIAAQVHTRSDTNEAFDLFLVRRTDLSSSEPIEGVIEHRIHEDLVERLEDRVSAEELLARRKERPSWAQRPVPDVPTTITVDNAASAHYTIVDVFTRDRPGLLHLIARTLYDEGVSIASCKVNTEGNRVADVFYVEDRVNGGKLRAHERLEGLRATLLERVEAFHSDRAGVGA